MYLATTTVESFGEFVRRNFPPEQSATCTSLADYIDAWLELGEAPRECAGSFTVYLQTVILIIIEWQRDPDLLDYHGGDGTVVPRQVKVVENPPEVRDQHDWIDRERFAGWNYSVHHRPPRG